MAQPSLSEWSTAHQRLSQAPWPGPRPLDEADAKMLRGRSGDLERFSTTLMNHRLVVLHGASGVGKTSFLRAGLYPELEERTRLVVCTQYDRDSRGTGTDVAELLASEVRKELRKELGDIADTGEDFFAAVDAKYLDNIVIVFDQFEELLRYSGAWRDAVLNYLTHLNKTMHFKMVISLRSEYLHELVDFESRTQLFTYSQFRLTTIAPESAADIVRAANSDARQVVNESAIGEIAQQWQRAVAESAKTASIYDPYGQVGLLHLQAFLQHLWATRPADRDVINRQDVANAANRLFRFMRDALAKERVVGGPSLVFRGALVKSVQEKLNAAVQAAAELGVDPYLIHGAADMLVWSTGNLSSGGFKVVADGPDLATKAAGQQFRGLSSLVKDEHGDPLSLGGQAFRALADTILALADPSHDPQNSGGEPLDLLTATRRDLCEAADRRLSKTANKEDLTFWSDALGASLPDKPWTVDPEWLSCGPLYGLPAANAIVEELRRFALAIAWLRASHLLRSTSVGGGSQQMSLIHDGFGDAIQRWADDHVADPAIDFWPLTYKAGRRVDWSGKDGAEVVPRPDWPATAGNGSAFFHLVWRGLSIKANFKNAIFVNCDFRGTMFDECTFEGVAFVNCLMDGVVLSDCTVIGNPQDAGSIIGPKDLTMEVGAPRFFLTIDPEVAATLDRYRQSHIPEDARDRYDTKGQIYSPLPGRAVTRDNTTRNDERLLVDLDCDLLIAGGISIHGGRVSSVLARNLDASRGGIGFYRTAGSGLDFAELRRRPLPEDGAATITVRSSAIRNFTITSQVDEEPVAPDGRHGHVVVQITDSLIAQAWIGSGVNGRISISNSVTVQLWNTRPECAVTVRDSRVFDLVGVSAERCTELHSPAPESAEPASYLHAAGEDAQLMGGGLVASLQQLDYTRTVAAVEDWLADLERTLRASIRAQNNALLGAGPPEG